MSQELPVTPHPTHDYQCKNCEFWHKESAKKLLILNMATGQAMPFSEAVKQGIDTRDKFHSLSAMCFYNPQWVQQDSKMYCSHFSGRRTV